MAINRAGSYRVSLNATYKNCGRRLVFPKAYVYNHFVTRPCGPANIIFRRYAV
jgi:hypothetical protein